jgi:hypothetical protein
LDNFGPSTIFRLGVDPIDLGAGVTERIITVDWRGRSAGGQSTLRTYRVAWNDLPQYNPDYLRRLRLCRNEHDRTETAALGIMALLIHEIDKLSLRTVVEIGSGTDYEAARGETDPGVQVEVRGIREAETLRIPRMRLKEKTAQALGKNPEALVSVTTFRYGAEGPAHSFLHHVRRPARTQKRKKR